MPITIPEAMGWGVFWNPFGAPYQEVSARAKAGMVHGGAGLCGKLLKALLAAGVTPLLETPGERLVVEDGAVVGLDVTHAGAPLRLRAKKGVILASGGFEWNETYRKAFLPLEMTHPVSPPHNTGDGLRMAMSVGAELGNMGEAWWTPAVALPGETYDGAPLYRSEFSVRCLPHTLLVNRKGQRFTFTRSVILGRGQQCDVVLPEASVSRRHAQISVSDERCFLADLGSGNGTFLNGEALAQQLGSGHPSVVRWRR